MATIYVSNYNPVRFYKFEPTVNNKYNSRLLKDFQYEHTIFDHEYEASWEQPWQIGDVVKIQITSDTPNLILNTVDCNKKITGSSTFVQKQTNWKLDGTEVYEASIAITREDSFYFTIRLNEANSPILLVSDRQVGIQKIYDSLLCEYKHRKNINDLAFDTGILFELRIPSILSEPIPASEVIDYINQKRDGVLINSTQWLVYKWTIGDAYGVPNYFIEIINNIIGLSEFYLDGAGYTRSEASNNFERVGDLYYPMAGWSILLTESKNRTAYSYDISNTLSSDDLLLDGNERIIVAENKILNK